MLVAMIIVLVICIVGAISLDLAGSDERLSANHRERVGLFATADAGVQHARAILMHQSPDPLPDEGEHFIDEGAGLAWYEGHALPMPLGSYEVDAVYAKCGAPPPGYSLEAGNRSFRSDYWVMESRATLEGARLSSAEARVTHGYRKVVSQTCITR